MNRRGTEDTEISKRWEYWMDQMHKGHDLMLSVLRHPIEECGATFVALRNAVAASDVEVVFSDTEIVPGLARKFFLREGLIAPFLAAAREMNERGWILKVEDAYRDRTMQKKLALRQSVFDSIVGRLAWGNDGEAPSVASVVNHLSAVIAHCPKTGTHMSGSALDISVLWRDDGRAVDRGAPYLGGFSELTPMASPFVSEEGLGNREAITALMEGHDFIAYPYEFWHYSSCDGIAEFLLGADKPGRYGPVDWDEAAGRVTPIENATEPLNSDAEMEKRIEIAMERLKTST